MAITFTASFKTTTRAKPIRAIHTNGFSYTLNGFSYTINDFASAKNVTITKITYTVD
jgi:hypothetical protein